MLSNEKVAFACHQGAALTQQSENEVQLILHCGAREQGPAGSHLIEYTAHPPRERSRAEEDRSHRLK